MKKWKIGAIVGAVWGFVSARVFQNFIITTPISHILSGEYKVTFTVLGKVICFPTWMIVKFYFHDTINFRLYTLDSSIFLSIFIGSIIIGVLIGAGVGYLIDKYGRV